MRWRPRRPSLSDQPHGAASRRGCRVACGGGLFAPISCKVRGGAGWEKCERADKPGSVVGATIYLERTSPCASSTQPERTEGRPYRVPICACSRWGFPSRAVADALVRSCRTVSAFLPRDRSRTGEFPFLWHFPSGCPAQPLAGILPFGARTFLAPKHAVAWPTRICYSISLRASRDLQSRAARNIRRTDAHRRIPRSAAIVNDSPGRRVGFQRDPFHDARLRKHVRFRLRHRRRVRLA